MLILLSSSGSGPAPSLPDLHIRDSENGNNVPVGGVEGWDNDFLQVQGICYAPMEFQSEEAVTAGSKTSMFWCRRLSKFLIFVKFATSGASAVIRPVYADKNDVEVIGGSITVNATSNQDAASQYLAAIEIVDTYGANKAGVLVESISSGTVNIAVAGV